MSEFTGRRLPIYLVLDVSGSMTGEPIEACRQGLKALLSDLRSDPQALETAYLSVITFSGEANQVSPLTEIGAFTEPMLSAGGGTSFGKVLDLLTQSIDREVRKSTPTQKGDWKPLVFFLTDGCPTDPASIWEDAAATLKARKIGNIIACAAGPSADKSALLKITETVVELSSLQPEQLKAFFRWVSASIKVTSVKAGGTGGVTLPPPPAGIVLVP